MIPEEVVIALTVTQIRHAKPREKGYKLADQNGLYLYVSPKGSKSWRYKYRYDGKEKRLTFGLFPEVGLNDAREKRNSAWATIRAGKDPAPSRRRQSRISNPEDTFEFVAEEWLADQCLLWAPANAFRVRSRLEKDIFPAIGKMPVNEIDGPIVLRALRAIEARGAIETAKRVRGYVLAVLKRAHAEGRVPATVVHSVECIGPALKPAMPVIRQPALTKIDELLELQRAVDCSTAGSVAKLASRFLALTVPRVGILRTATWSEFEGIDWDRDDQPSSRAVWRIPAQRMKLDVEDKGEPGFSHDIPLSLQAVEVLRAARILTGRFEFVFINSRSWRIPMTDATLSALYKRLGGGRYKNRMVPHGWRTAFSTILNERAAELDRPGDRLLIDMALAHVPAGVSASEWAYNRARYLKPRAALYQTWADMVTQGLPSPWRLVKPARASKSNSKFIVAKREL